KMRGQAPLPGAHTVRIDADGVQVFPRIAPRVPLAHELRQRERLGLGHPELNKLLGGGIPAGDVVLVCGPSRTGKSVLTRQFIVDGARAGQPGVIAIFDEHPLAYIERAEALGFELRSLIDAGLVELLWLPGFDLAVDEFSVTLQSVVERVHARRVG